MGYAGNQGPLGSLPNCYIEIMYFLHIDLQHNVSNLQHLNTKVQHSCAEYALALHASCKWCMVIYNIFTRYKMHVCVHPKSVRHLSERPQVLSSVLTALKMLQPRVLSLLIHVDFMDSQSNC